MKHRGRCNGSAGVSSLVFFSEVVFENRLSYFLLDLKSPLAGDILKSIPGGGVGVGHQEGDHI